MNGQTIGRPQGRVDGWDRWVEAYVGRSVFLCMRRPIRCMPSRTLRSLRYVMRFFQSNVFATWRVTEEER